MGSRLAGFGFEGIAAGMVAVLALAACGRGVRGPRPVAQLLLTGGPIHTMEGEGAPPQEALAIRGDRILFVGSRRAAEAYVGEGTRVVDLGGRAAFPGLVDAHAHLAGLGLRLATLDLTGTGSYEEVCLRVAEEVRAAPPGKWIIGRGWDQNDWPLERLPDHGPLSRVSPGHPVVLTRIDGHAILANRVAMERAGIGRDTPDPPGGKIHHDRGTGEPTGVFVDAAMELVTRLVPQPDRAERRREILLALRECVAHGLTGVHDMGVDRETLALYRDLLGEGELDFRIYAVLDGESPDLEAALARGPLVGLGRHRLTARAVKLYADGALGSRGAALLEPYRDDPGNRGLVLATRERIRDVTRRCLAAGFQVCTHAIGDRGNRNTLDAYEAALASVRASDPRLRIEHAQVVALADIERFASLGVIPSMQPTHCTSDMDWAEERLGPARIRGAYAWRRFLDAGCRIPCGSDFPVEGVDPLAGVYAAVTRQHPDGTPAGGWQPDQRMTRFEALRGFTGDAAYAAFEEDLLGTLAPGKLADVSVFTRDLLACPPGEILEARAWMTVVAGKIVYRAGD